MKPLSGIRIITLENFASAPYGTMLLADLGAEVIKIEYGDIGGDLSRTAGGSDLGPLDSLYFQSFNLGKRSVSLDITTDRGKEEFRRLVRTADAVVNNLRGSKASTLGVDYPSLKHVNPAIVCLHISGYGRTNERADWPGFDFLMQAETGFMSMTGEPDGPPSRAGLSIIDTMSGAIGVVGLLSCLIEAQRTGQGCDVDTCLFDVALHQLSYVGTWSLNGSKAQSRQPRSAHMALTPVQTFRTRDGWIFVMCMTDKFWELLVPAIGESHLLQDPRFSSMQLRRKHREELSELLDRRFCQKDTRHWIEVLAGKVPVAPVLGVDEALSSDFVRQNGMVVDIEHSRPGGFRALANPLRINGKRPTQSAAPSLGADNGSFNLARTEEARG